MVKLDTMFIILIQLTVHTQFTDIEAQKSSP